MRGDACIPRVNALGSELSSLSESKKNFNSVKITFFISVFLLTISSVHRTPDVNVSDVRPPPLMMML